MKAENAAIILGTTIMDPAIGRAAGLPGILIL